MCRYDREIAEKMFYIYIHRDIYLEGKGVTGGCWRGVLSPGAFSGMFYIYIQIYVEGKGVTPGSCCPHPPAVSKVTTCFSKLKFCISIS